MDDFGAIILLFVCFSIIFIGCLGGLSALVFLGNNINLKACPFCREYIKKAATTCKHCKKDLP